MENDRCELEDVGERQRREGEEILNRHRLRGVLYG